MAQRIGLRLASALALFLAPTLWGASGVNAAEPAPSRDAQPQMAPAAALPGAPPSAPAITRGPVTNLPLPRFVSMRADTANARRGPSMDQRVDWTFNHRGLPLRITNEYGQWRRVEDADGAGGWVHQMLLSGVRTVIVTATEPVPLRPEPEEGGRPRAILETGVIAKVEACSRDWCEVEAGGASGWLPRSTVWGVGPDEEIE